MMFESPHRRRTRCLHLWLLLAQALAWIAIPVLAQETRFTEHPIKDGYTYSYGIAAADLDGDGDLDLTSADTRSFKRYWFENDGRGAFTQHVIENDYRERLERHALADVNRDGRPDVVIVENLHGDLLWYKNSGSPARDEHWQRFTIAKGAAPGAYDVAPADFDGDGDLDAAISTWRLSNKFVWFENPGDVEQAPSWKMHSVEDNVGETRTIRVGDFNGDGKPDLLGTARDTNLAVWYQNPGDPREQPWKRHTIDAASAQPCHGMPADLDADGDLDVVLALGMILDQGDNTRQIVWYENVGGPGQGTDWKKHVIGSDFNFAFEAIAVDLNADGKLDVAATSWASPGGRVVWFENSGDPRGAWKLHPLKADWARANQIIAADLNGDQRPDLIAGAEVGANEVRWWRNEGQSK
jgi:hypothetical protein